MSDDFIEQLMQGKKKYQEEQEGSTKRRKFSIGLDIHGRLLPYEHDGSMRFMETFYHHYFQSIKGDSWVFLACPKNGNDWEASCEFCDSMLTHYKEHGSDSIYNAYKRKRKFKVNFFVTDVKTLPGYTVADSDLGMWKEVLNQVIVLDLPFTLKEKIDMALNNEDLGLNIFNPLNGFDLQIKISLKKTDDNDMPQYNLSEFSRKQTAIPGELRDILSNCANITSQIDLLKKADASRIHDIAVAEGLSASNIGSASLPQSDTSSTPASTNTPAESAPPTNNITESAPKEEGSSLQDIFTKYRTT